MLKKMRILFSSVALSALASMSGCKQPEYTVLLKGTTEKVEYAVGERVTFAEKDAEMVSTASALTSLSSEVKLRTRLVADDILEAPAGKHIILQYEKNLSDDDSRELEEKGIHILEPLQSKTYIASLEATPASMDTSTKKAKKLINFTLEDKIDPLILGDKYNWGSSGADIGYTIAFFKDIPKETAEDLLVGEGATIVGASSLFNLVKVAVPESAAGSFVENFAKLDEVQYIAPIEVRLTHTNFNTRALTMSEALTGSPLMLSGEGVTLGVYDAGLISGSEEDLAGRLHRSTIDGFFFDSFHARHVGCTAAGDGSRSMELLEMRCGHDGATVCNYLDSNSPLPIDLHPIYDDELLIKRVCTTSTGATGGWDGICADLRLEDGTLDREVAERYFRGIATKSRVLSDLHGDCSPYCLWNDPNEMVQKYLSMILEWNAKVITNSIGSNASFNWYPCEINGSHDLTAYLINAIVAGRAWDRPTTILYAAGNERGSARCLAEKVGYDSIGAPAAGAKNAIIVGATEILLHDPEDAMDDEVTSAFYDSYGPTDDGRIGISFTINGGGNENPVMSCGSNDYIGMMGTSMATPAAAGFATLIYQYGLIYGVEIVPSLVKAVLATSTTDLGLPGPDFIYGFGDLMGSGPVIRDILMLERFKRGVLNNGEEHIYYLNKGSDAVRLTLAYTDALESLNALKVLVNDLDVEVISPSGMSYLPLVPDALSPGEAATAKKDELNNIEQIVLSGSSAEMPEVWKVKVKGYDVLDPDQEYSLASSADFYRAETASISSDDPVDVSLTIDAFKLDCAKECSYRYLETPLDDVSTGTTRSLEREIRLKDIFPGFVPKEAGYYRMILTVVDSSGTVLMDDSDSPYRRNFDFYVH
ncbi:S8 family serine peptidase [Candidatus Woesearchaeota archaeon]|nr:S8 family serine peptidase [Candidatus Woesearchaeota archaeon]